MKKKINVSFSLSRDTFERFRAFCKENNIIMSGSIDTYMESMLLRNS